MSFNYSKLRGRIIEKYGTLTVFAEKLGASKQIVSRKMNGHVSFSQKDIVLWCDLLDIPAEEAGAFFLKQS